MLSQEFIEEMKAKLLESKAQLEEEMAGMPLHAEMGDDREANSDEVGPDEVSEDVHKRITADLQKIDAALAKIDAGTYGTDDEGKEISEERLRVIPWADKSIND